MSVVPCNTQKKGCGSIRSTDWRIYDVCSQAPFNEAVKTALVLSGGGARGIMHAGVLQAIDEAGIDVHYIAATSAGAIVGALYSCGYAPQEILRLIKSYGLLKLLRPSARRGGFFSTRPIRAVISKYLGKHNFASLEIPMTIVATDISSGKPVYFHEGPLVDVIAASSAVPVLLVPVRIADRYFVDGGITDNFPLAGVRIKADYTIGVHCNAVFTGYKKGNVRSMMERTMLLAINGNVTPQKHQVDLLIEPEKAGTYSAFAYWNAEEIFEIGYKKAEEKLRDTPLV